MVVESIAPGLLVFAALAALGALICALWPFYDQLTRPKGVGKLETLDGLRAYLAVGVFLHHGVITYGLLTKGVWDFPETSFYRLLGPCAVGLFFMITAFLFWTKAIRGPASLPARKLLVGRVFRIGPMLLFVSALVYGTIFVETGFRLRGTPAELVIGLGSPLTLGLLQWRPFNGVDAMPLNAHVNWTLQYEWAFYLVLPILAVLATPRRFLILLAAGAVVAVLSLKIPYSFEMLTFLAGMVAAHAIQSFGEIRALKGRVASVVCVASLALIPYTSLLGYRTEKLAVIGVLFFVFLCVVNGNAMFGALTNRGVKFLGSISYSLYLIHGFVLYLGRPVLMRAGGPVPSPAVFWAFMLACGVVTVVVSAFTYRFIEHPFIALGHRRGRNLPEAIKPPAESGPASQAGSGPASAVASEASAPPEGAGVLSSN